jgi:hypothetical protein
MRIWMLAASAAALAITPPALAQRGGHGGGHGGQNDKNQAQKGGGDRAQARASHGGGGNRGQVKADRGKRGEVAQTWNRGHDRMNAGHARTRDDVRGNRELHARANDGRQAARSARFEDRGGHGRGHDKDARALRADRDNGARFVNESHLKDRGKFSFADGEKVFRVRDVNRGVVRYRDVDRDQLFARRVGWVDGCPPGLAKKNLACLPPGQAARFVGQPLIAASRIAALDPLPRSLRSLYYDDDDYYYRYGGGYLYRVDRGDDLISSIVPLFGAALLGQPLQPSYINSAYRPSYYNAFYPNSPYDCHQYGYGYVYETDCMTGMVEDVIPTYDYGYGVGQLLPSSYSYYNVPYAYRGYYPDTNDYYYRYAPGAIYQVDRSTSVISAVASLLTGGLTVGQPLPMGYSAYNVPYDYRTTYYDTPDTWYRYNNGYIYAVDPTTQLVRSIVQAIV